MSFFSKVSQNIKSKVSGYQISQDPEYDTLHDRYQARKKNIEVIEHHLKDLKKHMSGLHKHLAGLNEAFTKEYDTHSDVRLSIGQGHGFFTQAEKVALEKCLTNIQYKVSDQLASYKNSLEGVKSTLEKRDQAKIRYDNANNKYTSLVTAKNKIVDPGKLQAAKIELNHSIEVYNAAAFDAKRDLFNLHECQSYNHLVASFYDCMGEYSADLANNLTKLAPISKAIRDFPVSTQSYSGGQTIAPTFETPSQPNYQQEPQPIYPSQQAPKPSKTNVPPQYDSEWYYLDANLQQHGPVDFSTLKSIFHKRELTATNQVFGGSLSNWTALSQVDNGALMRYLST